MDRNSTPACFARCDSRTTEGTKALSAFAHYMSDLKVRPKPNQVLLFSMFLAGISTPTTGFSRAAPLSALARCFFDIDLML